MSPRRGRLRCRRCAGRRRRRAPGSYRSEATSGGLEATSATTKTHSTVAADSAYYQHKVGAAVRAAGARFSITARTNQQITKAIAAVMPFNLTRAAAALAGSPPTPRRRPRQSGDD